jgi:methylmalonyl-CoA mutase
LNTQLILREECHLHRVQDPAGGSWYVEFLTDALARRAWRLLQEVEGRGGMAVALHEGLVWSKVEDSAQRRRRALAEGRSLVTGVSAYPMVGEELPEAKPDGGRARSVGLAHPGPSPGEPAEATAGDADGGFCTEAALDAAREGAALVELAARFERGSPTIDAPALDRWRDAEPFEELRLASQHLRAQQGASPAVGLIRLDESPQCRERAAAARRLLAAAGVEVRELGGAGDPGEIPGGFAAAGLRCAVLCGSDEVCEQRVPALAADLRGAGAACVALAGGPGGRPDGPALGMDVSLHEGGDGVAALRMLLRCLGATT